MGCVGHGAQVGRTFQENDWESIYKMMGMYPNFFHFLVDHPTAGLMKVDMNWRQVLKPGLKMGMTLQYFASTVLYAILPNHYLLSSDSLGARSIWEKGTRSREQYQDHPWQVLADLYQAIKPDFSLITHILPWWICKQGLDSLTIDHVISEQLSDHPIIVMGKGL